MTMTAPRTVTMIPARENLIPLSTEEVKRRLRVAAYARVSTDAEEQLSSYNAQVAYYTEKIRANDEWQFMGVYTDEGTPYGQNPIAR